jgi:uncharacterized membrane protein
MLARHTPLRTWAIICTGFLASLQALRLGTLRLPIVIMTLATFCVLAFIVFRNVAPTPIIDVFMFQQTGASRLLHGLNPYLPGYPNLYGPNQHFYGPGMVGDDNLLTVGVPYPPVSLLLALPAYVIGGDVRFADIAGITASALLLILCRPGRWTGLTAMLFLLTPRVLLIIELSWTEALFVMTFSLVMFCALRWKAGLPYALGLFFATKQYSILTLPFVSFLAAAEGWKGAVRLIAKALSLAAVVTLPFVLWNPHAFWRSVVEFQIRQPFRADALSHLVWIRAALPQSPLVMLAPFVGYALATALVLWRSPRTPAYFAAGTTFVWLVFVAFNKQAFCNYYYFAIATACWAAAASSADDADRRIQTS